MSFVGKSPMRGSVNELDKMNNHNTPLLAGESVS